MVYFKKWQPPEVDLEQMAFSRDTMMRIAIAGTSGLARTLAYHINETVHQFIILSRYVNTTCLSLFGSELTLYRINQNSRNMVIKLSS